MSWRARLAAYGALLRLPRLWRFAPASIAVNGVVGLWFSRIPPLLSRTHHDPEQFLQGGWTGREVFLIFLGFGLAFTTGIYFWSRLYARLRKTNVMLIAIGGAVATCVILFAIDIQLLPGPWGQWPLVPLVLAAFFAPLAYQLKPLD